MSETALIAGHGPGFCEELAWELADAGYAIGLFARSEDYIESFATTLREADHEAAAIATDITDPEQVTTGINSLRDRFGPVTVLAHTASTTTDIGGELDPDRFEQLWRLYTHSGLLCFRTVKDDLEAHNGTALFFGATPEIGDYAYKSAKRATRGLARSLATEYGPEGIHVAHVTIAGSILNPDVYDRRDEVIEEEHIDPAAAAATCRHLVEQDDRGRTFDLDLHTAAQTNVY
ncbi:MAG: SDR family NAD(P)-dependent oxidoreductase [Halobacteriales archaeon]|nr:SDR family NAD(P)-dependent oxidoreductase [Halobacteriales archaeon]